MKVEVVGKSTFFPVPQLFISVGRVIGIVSLDPVGRVEDASLLVCEMFSDSCDDFCWMHMRPFLWQNRLSY